MPLTFTTTNSTGLAGGYAYVPLSSFSRGGGSFVSVSGRFGAISLTGVSQTSKSTLSKEPNIQQIYNRTRFVAASLLNVNTVGAITTEGNASLGTGTFVYVAGSFGSGLDAANASADSRTVSKDPSVAKILLGINIGKNSVKVFVGGQGDVTNATTYALPSVFTSGLFGGQGVFGNASMMPTVQSLTKVYTIMYFGVPVKCPFDTVSSTSASYAFWS